MLIYLFVNIYIIYIRMVYFVPPGLLLTGVEGIDGTFEGRGRRGGLDKESGGGGTLSMFGKV